MNIVAKILIVLNLILAVGFLASAANFLEKQDLWKDKYELKVADLDGKLNAEKEKYTVLKDEYNTASTQLLALQERIGKAEGELGEARQQNDLLKQAFNENSQQLTNATAALEKAQATIESNRTMIDNLTSERSALAEAKQASLEAKEAAVRNLAEKELQFESLMAAKQTLEARVEQLGNELRSAQLAAQTAIAKAGGAVEGVPLNQPAHTGQVLTVDNDHNVAIISLGAEDGVQPGFRYTISRGSNYVGVLEITDVQARKSAGRSISNLQKSNLKRGDRVMSR